MKKLLMFLILFCPSYLAFSLNYMEIKEIRPGMKGYGLSVFKGWEPERFEVEIIDVIVNSAPKRSVILAKLKGQNLEKSGVIAGMSGSPVYIDNKLIGAVAYTWSFSKEAICGITPFEEMLKEAANLKKKNVSSFINEDEYFKKIATPIFLNGFTGFSRSYLEEFFRTKKLFTSSIFLEGGNIETSSLNSKFSDLHPGDAVAINLVDGDLSIQAIGTITHIEGKDVYIFGHPMNEEGEVSLPISKAYIFTVIPSSYLSFKIGTSSIPVGSAIYDGQNAVYARLGEKANMIPFEVNIVEKSLSNSYNFRIVNSPTYFSSLATASVLASILNQTGYLDEKRVRLKFEIEFEAKEKTYKITNDFYYSYFPSYYNLYSLAMDLNSFFSIFFYSDVEKFVIRRVRIFVEISPEAFFYVLEDFGVDKQQYLAGEVIRCKLVLKAFRGDYTERYFYFKIPQDIPDGKYILFGGNEAYFYSELRKTFPYYFQINSVEDIVRWGNLRTDPLKFIIALVSVEKGLIIKGKPLENFPEIYLPYFSSVTERTSVPILPKIFKEEMNMDSVVFNSTKIQITIGKTKPKGKD